MPSEVKQFDIFVPAFDGTMNVTAYVSMGEEANISLSEPELAYPDSPDEVEVTYAELNGCVFDLEVVMINNVPLHKYLEEYIKAIL